MGKTVGVSLGIPQAYLDTNITTGKTVSPAIVP
jgi:hypothetical protein